MLTSLELAVVYILVMTTTAFVVGYVVLAIEFAGKKQPALRGHARKLQLMIVVWTLACILVALAISRGFVYAVPLVVIMPVSALWMMFLPNSSRIIVGIPLHLLIALGFYRVVGALFLFLYYNGNSLSQGFALNAGWGDVMTGIFAIPVAWWVWKKRSFAGFVLLAWSIFGIFDLILAPASAVIYGGKSLFEFPLVYIPVFLGPPFGIFLHLLTLRVAWLQGAGKTCTESL